MTGAVGRSGLVVTETDTGAGPLNRVRRVSASFSEAAMTRISIGAVAIIPSMEVETASVPAVP
jgi:hypothetical protein